MGRLTEDLNVLGRLQDIYRTIDRCLDVRDPRGFRRASRELREVLCRLRDLIDRITVADIISRGQPPQAAGAAPPA